MFVEPDHIGHGFGRELMRHAIARAGEAEHVERLVIQADPNAARFYESAGAVRIGERASDSIGGRMLPLYEIRLHEEK